MSCSFRVSARHALPLRRLIRTTQPRVHPTTGITLSKAKGQHLIHNQGVLNKMLEAADLKSSDTVFEVGCGTGELTMRILPYVRQVYTVDIEQRMAQETQNRAHAAGHTNLETAVGNVLKMPMPRRFDVCLSNLPYQISSPFLFKLLQRLSPETGAPPWRAAVLMVQKEVAERLLADPGEKPFSRLALNVRLFAQTIRVCDVKPGSFVPAPKVHSTVIKLIPRVPAPQIDFAEWDAMVRVIFSRRRKTLKAQFSKLSTISMLEQNHKIWCSMSGRQPDPRPFPELLRHVLESEGMLNDRAFAMDIDDLHSLLRAFNRVGVRFINVQDPTSDLDAWTAPFEDEDDPFASTSQSVGARGSPGSVDADVGAGPYSAGPSVSSGHLSMSGRSPWGGLPPTPPPRPTDGTNSKADSSRPKGTAKGPLTYP